MGDNTNAVLLDRSRTELADGIFVETVVWRLPHPIAGSAHLFKYRLALVVDGECVLRYDNERGKGDHRHLEGAEQAIRFTTLAALLAAFDADVTRLLK